MSTGERYFTRLDSADKRHAPFDVVAYEGVIPVNEEAAKDLMLDPLPLLTSQIEEVEKDWRVSIDRVNAEAGFWWPPVFGPHHLCVLAMVLPRFREVHCLVHRFPKDEEVNAS
jgi:hypothetical protein